MGKPIHQESSLNVQYFRSFSLSDSCLISSHQLPSEKVGWQFTHVPGLCGSLISGFNTLCRVFRLSWVAPSHKAYFHCRPRPQSLAREYCSGYRLVTSLVIYRLPESHAHGRHAHTACSIWSMHAVACRAYLGLIHLKAAQLRFGLHRSQVRSRASASPMKPYLLKGHERPLNFLK